MYNVLLKYLCQNTTKILTSTKLMSKTSLDSSYTQNLKATLGTII